MHFTHFLASLIFLSINVNSHPSFHSYNAHSKIRSVIRAAPVDELGVSPFVHFEHPDSKGVKLGLTKLGGPAGASSVDIHRKRGIERLSRMTGIETSSTADLDLTRMIKRSPRWGYAAATFEHSTPAVVKTLKTNQFAATTGVEAVAVPGQLAVTNAISPTGVNSLGLTIEGNDIGYFATLQIGTPPAPFKILMDSGSADFWVASVNCSSCGRHARLSSTTSTSFVDSGRDFSITYGTGTVQGTTGSDTVNIAGLVLKNLAFGTAQVESSDFGANAVPFDGLMGLAKSSLSVQKVKTPIEVMQAAELVGSAQMGFHLARLSDGTNDGEITFGGVDASKFTGSLTEFPNVNPTGFWEGAMDSVSVNGVSLGLSGRTAILDTGTTLIIAPPADAAAVHAAIPGSGPDGAGGFTVPCSMTQSVALSFGGTAFAINPSDIAFAPVPGRNGICSSGISSGAIGGANQWLVGDVFLKNVYFATDVGSNSMGLAPSVAK